MVLGEENSMNLYDHLKLLADKFNVYPRLVEECIQEMAVAYLEGKTTEQELFKVCVNVGYYTKRFTPCSHFLEKVVYIEPLFTENDSDYLLNFLAKATEQSIISLEQANYLYQWLLGDADKTIAKQFKKDRSTITWHRNKAIRSLRNHFELVC